MFVSAASRGQFQGWQGGPHFALAVLVMRIQRVKVFWGTSALGTSNAGQYPLEHLLAQDQQARQRVDPRTAHAVAARAADAGAQKKLEAVLHPRIHELWRVQLQNWRDEGKPLAVVVILLLFETQAESEFDAIICVACSAPTQQERLPALYFKISTQTVFSILR